MNSVLTSEITLRQAKKLGQMKKPHNNTIRSVISILLSVLVLLIFVCSMFFAQLNTSPACSNDTTLADFYDWQRLVFYASPITLTVSIFALLLSRKTPHIIDKTFSATSIVVSAAFLIWGICTIIIAAFPATGTKEVTRYTGKEGYNSIVLPRFNNEEDSCCCGGCETTFYFRQNKAVLTRRMESIMNDNHQEFSYKIDGDIFGSRLYLRHGW